MLLCCIFLDMDIYHFLSHDGEEVGEGDFPRAVLVHLANHLFDLLLLRFKPQSSHRNLGQREWGRRRVRHTWRTDGWGWVFEHFYLELLDIDVSWSIGVKQLKGLPDLLLLLLGQLRFGGRLLARRWHWTLQGWSLGTGRLGGYTGGGGGGGQRGSERFL